MAEFIGNPEHLKIVKKGTDALNQWRKWHPYDRLDLRGADLRRVNLTAANLLDANLVEASLVGANLCQANLIGADLFGANLTSAYLIGANLVGANLVRADLNRSDLGLANLHRVDLDGANLGFANLNSTDLRKATLRRADLVRADLFGANLSGANLSSADLSGTDLSGADLGGADLFGAKLVNTILNETIFAKTLLGNTIFFNTHLSGANGLDTCRHAGPSAVDISVLSMANELPKAFLRGIGLPDLLINDLPSYFEDAITYHSLFISYSTKDEPFANRLYQDLQDSGVRCWYSPKDAQGGKYLLEQLDTAIHLHDRVLLILTEHSMKSEWVILEITKALEKEKNENRRVLFPISLAPFEEIKKWKRYDSGLGGDVAKEIRKYFIPDFSKSDKYDESFGRLIRDLKTEGSGLKRGELG